MMDIRPGIGIGPVALRSSPERVRGFLGAPNDTDTTAGHVEWIYDNIDLSVTFEENQVTTIEAYGDVAIDGNAISDKPMKEIAETLEKCGWTKPEKFAGTDVETWVYDNGVKITFSNGEIDAVTLEDPARAKRHRPDPIHERLVRLRRRRYAFWGAFCALVCIAIFWTEAVRGVSPEKAVLAAMFGVGALALFARALAVKTD